jgi:hypothetical protein
MFEKGAVCVQSTGRIFMQLVALIWPKSLVDKHSPLVDVDPTQYLWEGSNRAVPTRWPNVLVKLKEVFSELIINKDS